MEITTIIVGAVGLIVGAVVGYISGKNSTITAINEKFGFIVITRKGNIRNPYMR